MIPIKQMTTSRLKKLRVSPHRVYPAPGPLPVKAGKRSREPRIRAGAVGRDTPGTGTGARGRGGRGRLPLRNTPARLLSVLAALIFLALGAGYEVPRCETERILPFGPGEKLTFGLRWGVIPAGKAVLEVLPNERLNGEQVRHFALTARTNAFVDMFYKVRDRIDAYTDLEMNHSVYYRKDQQEGDTRRRIIVEFDWEIRQATYSNFGGERKTVSLREGTFDPLSILYYTRMASLGENSEITRPVTDGKKNLVGRARIFERERIRLPVGDFSALLMEPDMAEVGGVFEKDRDARLQLWVTADERRLLVKLKSKVVVGSFVAELVAMEMGGRESIPVLNAGHGRSEHLAGLLQR